MRPFVFLVSTISGIALCAACPVALAASDDGDVLPGSSSLAEGGADCVMVDAKHRTKDKRWTARETRVLGHLKEFSPGADVKVDKFGGWMEREFEATGFFYVKEIDGHWRFVDPDGQLWIAAGVCSVQARLSPGVKASFDEAFGAPEKWAEATATLLRSAHFNSLGRWSDWETFRQTFRPLPYTTSLSFMAAYGKRRGGTYRQPGHTGYPDDCIFVFDPEFEPFCDEFAAQLEATKDDPYLVGHFSDNELPFRENAAVARALVAEHLPAGKVTSK